MLRKIVKWLMVKSKFDFSLRTADRAILESKILPWLSTRQSMTRVLFVGCEWYTYGYRKWFEPDTYWTLDYNSEKKVFGSPQRHIVDSMANLADHFGPESLDLIICNGVFGWGLNVPAEIETAFSAVHRLLRPRGLFLLGWNDRPKRRPVPIENIAALRALSPEIIEPLGVSRFLTRGRNRHTYNLYVKS